MILRLFFSFFFIFIFITDSFAGQDELNGNIRLILNEKTGGFSLFYLAQADKTSARYEPLFNSADPDLSYASISVNGRVFRLGDRGFRAKYERYNGNPSFIFTSQNITVRQIFTPYKTPNSQNINCVMITFIIENTGNQDIAAGLRIILDTDLGDPRGRVPFITSSHIITRETLTQGNAGERFWISRGQNVSLMGSIINPVNPAAKAPDYIHFASFRRLNNSRWRLRYSPGRAFKNDSAVCYIYEPENLRQGNSFTYSIFLSSEDISWYNSVNLRGIAVPREAPTLNIEAIVLEAISEAELNNENPSMSVLLKLQELINNFISGGLYMNEQDLMEIEKVLERYR